MIWIVMLPLLGALLGVCSLYAALKFGVVFGVSLLTVVFVKGLDSFLSTFRVPQKRSNKDHGYYLAFTTGMSFSTITIISTVLASLALSGNLPTQIEVLIIWIVLLNLTGTMMAWFHQPLLKELPFPTATTTVGLINSSNLAKTQKTFWWAFSASSVITVLKQIWNFIPSTLILTSTSPMFVGLGGILGIQASLTFFIGGGFFFGPFAKGLASWMDLAWFSISGLLAWIILDLLHALNPMNIRWMSALKSNAIIAGLLMNLLSLFVFGYLFPVRIWILLISLIFPWPLAYLASRVTGETDVTPIGGLGKLMIFIFNLLPGHAFPVALSALVVGPAAASADFSSDLKSGALLDCNPKRQLVFQLCGAVLGPILFVPLFFHFLPLVGSSEFPVPAAAIWNQFLEVLQSDFSTINETFSNGMYLGILMACVFFLCRKYLKWLPSPVPFFVAYYLELEVTNAILVGGLIQFFLAKHFKRKDNSMIWMGLLAGEALFAVAFLF